MIISSWGPQMPEAHHRSASITPEASSHLPSDLNMLRTWICCFWWTHYWSHITTHIVFWNCFVNMTWWMDYWGKLHEHPQFIITSSSWWPHRSEYFFFQEFIYVNILPHCCVYIFSCSFVNFNVFWSIEYHLYTELPRFALNSWQWRDEISLFQDQPSD